MQDTMEPGVFAVPSATGPTQRRGIMSGQRREFGAGAAGLDRQITDRLRERGHVTVMQSVPRKATRWIDWFGNLEVSPPHTDRQGRRFPYGRIITGRQRELAMHPDALRFLEAQGMQWPPIVLDTSWLTIGHVDEMINFVPAKGATGYKVLLPSPRAARTLLESLVQRQLGALPVFAGTRDETTVATLLAGAAVSEENVGIDGTVARIREQLQHELNIREADVAMIPCLFNRGRALIPNAVNCLAVNGHLVATQPKGPREGDKDLFEEAIRGALAGCDVDITFIDAWRAYHMGSGEVHCGTNTFRRLTEPAWWKFATV
jgi:protein-arginine deiminase